MSIFEGQKMKIPDFLKRGEKGATFLSKGAKKGQGATGQKKGRPGSKRGNFRPQGAHLATLPAPHKTVLPKSVGN